MHGTVALVGGVLTYTPTLNYNGADSFTYTVGDGHGGVDTATVTVNVTGVNDAPTAVANTGQVNEDAQVTINLVANDTDPDLPYGDNLTIVAGSISGAKGSVQISADGKSITYTADDDSFDLLTSSGPGSTATDTFTYMVRDVAGQTSQSTVTITVTGVSDGRSITGANQADTITVGNGNKNTSAGEDTVRAGNGNDSVAGGDGADQLFGENGNDSLDGGNGIDQLWGGAGDDSLMGGAGNDLLRGEQGSDFLRGGGGADTFIFVGGYATTERDVIFDLTGGPDGDKLQFLSGLTVTSATTANLVGSSAPDVLLTMNNGSSIVLADLALTGTGGWNGGAGWLVA